MRSQLYQLYGHYLIISPLHRHREVANENPLILPWTLSIVGALVLFKRHVGKKKKWAPLLGLPKSIYYSTIKNAPHIPNTRQLNTIHLTYLWSCKNSWLMVSLRCNAYLLPQIPVNGAYNKIITKGTGGQKDFLWLNERQHRWKYLDPKRNEVKIISHCQSPLTASYKLTDSTGVHCLDSVAYITTYLP